MSVTVAPATFITVLAIGFFLGLFVGVKVTTAVQGDEAERPIPAHTHPGVGWSE